jgi:hypothetical protein
VTCGTTTTTLSLPHLSAGEAFELTVRHPVDVDDPLELFPVGMIDH